MHVSCEISEYIAGQPVFPYSETLLMRLIFLLEVDTELHIILTCYEKLFYNNNNLQGLPKKKKSTLMFM